MSARLKTPLNISLRTSRIFTVSVLILHLLALIALLFIPIQLLYKVLALCLLVLSYFKYRLTIRWMMRISGLRISNDEIVLLVDSKPRNVKNISDQVVTQLFVVLKLDMAQGAAPFPKTYYLPVFYDAVSGDDNRLLRRYVRST